MNQIPSEKELANLLIDQMPYEAELMLEWFGQRFPADKDALKHAKADNSFAVGILVALLHRTKADRPPIHESAALEILVSLNGISLPPLPYQGLPAILADTVSSGIIQEPHSEPLRREIDEGVFDSEFTELLGKTRPYIMYDWCKLLEPEAALAIFVSAFFWWQLRALLPQDFNYTDAPESFHIREYFNLVEHSNSD